MTKTILLILLILTVQMATAQSNLIQNSSFEDLKNPNISSMRIADNLHHWQEVAVGDIGYVHPKSAYLKPNQNPYGKQEARTGKGLIMLKIAALPLSGGDNYGDLKRYYLQTQLSQNLQKGKKYHFEFYVNWAERSTLAIANISAFFLEKPIIKLADSPKKRMYRHEQSSSGESLDQIRMSAVQTIDYFKNETDTVIKNEQDWTKIEGEFIAKGTEKVLILGCFDMQKELKYEIKRKQKFNWYDAFYFVDDIALYEIKEDQPENLFVEKPSISTSGSKQEIVQALDSGKNVILANVNFEHEKHDLLSNSFAELNKIKSILQEHPNIKIEIQGHTDQVGDSIFNQILSTKRAQAVCDYLVAKGIDPTRMIVFGFGYLFPIASNRTSAGRRRNRRVSIRQKK